MKHRSAPFYALNRKFTWTACGTWWKTHTSKLHKAGLPWDAISNGLRVIEWFPYQSKRLALRRCLEARALGKGACGCAGANTKRAPLPMLRSP
jgi:hypothetical protein